jgi:hypothetical protein
MPGNPAAEEREDQRMQQQAVRASGAQRQARQRLKPSVIESILLWKWMQCKTP